jgi:hypothetical protein
VPWQIFECAHSKYVGYFTTEIYLLFNETKGMQLITLTTSLKKQGTVKVRLSGMLGEWGVPIDLILPFERTVTYNTQF